MAFSFRKSLAVIHIVFDTLWNESNMIFLHMSSRSSPFRHWTHPFQSGSTSPEINESSTNASDDSNDILEL